MKSSIQNSIADNAEFESTLRLIAQLPAPDGLAERVQASLRVPSQTAPIRARILSWPTALQINFVASDWLRTAAAAAIVFVVVGGAWGVYSRIQPAQPSTAIAAPPRTGSQGGFSNAGAMRTPQTLNGPTVQPLAQTPAAAPIKPIAQKQHHRGKSAAANQPLAQPNPPAAK
jgi:hypothetical protein